MGTGGGQRPHLRRPALPRLVLAPAAAEGHAAGTIRRQAIALLTSTACRDAFDLEREDPKLRDRYGRTLMGQGLLLGRRLVVSADVHLALSSAATLAATARANSSSESGRGGATMAGG